MNWHWTWQRALYAIGVACVLAVMVIFPFGRQAEEIPVIALAALVLMIVALSGWIHTIRTSGDAAAAAARRGKGTAYRIDIASRIMFVALAVTGILGIAGVHPLSGLIVAPLAAACWFAGWSQTVTVTASTLSVGTYLTETRIPRSLITRIGTHLPGDGILISLQDGSHVNIATGPAAWARIAGEFQRNARGDFRPSQTRQLERINTLLAALAPEPGPQSVSIHSRYVPVIVMLVSLVPAAAAIALIAKHS